MRRNFKWIVLVTAWTLAASPAPAAIDRHALVTRHNIEWNDPMSFAPAFRPGSGLWQKFAG
jgi:hypothetical protein